MEREVATLNEIYAQPEVWTVCLDVLNSLDLQKLVGDKHPNKHEWLFVGCGTSFYLAQAASATFTALGSRLARAVPASEILLFPSLVFPAEGGTIFPVLISRSGNTSEVLQVAEFLRERGVEFLVISCDGNALAPLSARTLIVPASEESTVMTSSFTSMLLALQYIAGRLLQRDSFVDTLHMLPGALSRLLEEYGPKVKQFGRQSFEDVAFLAQGALYPIASETALKVMESSSTYAQFFHTLEFRHGPKSIVSEKVLIGALLSESGYAEESAVLLEMKQIGARTIAIANQLTPEVRDAADLAIELNVPGPELARLVVYVVWGQLLGSYLGLHKGLDPDSPRHLTRVVTLAG